MFNIATKQDALNLCILADCIFREAENQSSTAMFAVGCVIRNRVKKHGDNNYARVILQPLQFSSYNQDSPRRKVMPLWESLAFSNCLDAAVHVLSGDTDVTAGATLYFDKTLDSNPPTWATNGKATHVVDLGDFHFYTEP